MTKVIDDILRGFSELQGTEVKSSTGCERAAGFLEEELDIEGRLVEEPTFVGKHVNTALKEAAAIVAGRGPGQSGVRGAKAP